MSADMWLHLPTANGDQELEATVFEGNLTYNLSPMLYEAGWEWHGQEGKTAETLLPLAESVLSNLKETPDKYQEMNPPNGWGNYDQAVEFMEKLVRACRAYPQSIVHLWL